MNELTPESGRYLYLKIKITKVDRRDLYTVYNDQAQMFRQTIIQSMVTAFVCQLASAYLSVENFNLIRHATRSIEITKTFKQILRRNFKSMKKPSEFAAKMNMTVSHLNDTVRSVTGFPVTYYIQQELMRKHNAYCIIPIFQ